MFSQRYWFAIVGIAILGTAGGTTRAGVVVDVRQVGSSVVTTASGTLDITDLTLFSNHATFTPGMTPTLGTIGDGPITATKVDVYSGISSTPPFGTGGLSWTTSASPNSDAISTVYFNNIYYLVVPHGYTSGSSLSASNTYANQTFSSLGLTPGTYTATWGNEAHADFFTVNVVPEPSTTILAAIGAGSVAAASLVSRKRRSPRLNIR